MAVAKLAGKEERELPLEILSHVVTACEKTIEGKGYMGSLYDLDEVAMALALLLARCVHIVHSA